MKRELKNFDFNEKPTTKKPHLGVPHSFGLYFYCFLEQS